MKELKRVFRFAAVGILNALIVALTIGITMGLLNLHYAVSNVIAYFFAQTHNFVWCKYWIFPTEKESSTCRQVLLFSMAFALAYTSQFFFLIALVEWLDCNEYLAQFLGLFVYGGINFLMNKWITFK